jgi:hypothetical protein
MLAISGDIPSIAGLWWRQKGKGRPAESVNQHGLSRKKDDCHLNDDEIFGLGDDAE